MRAAFDRLIDLYWGPSTGTPGLPFALNVPARAVPDNAFVDVDAPLSQSLLYVTMDVVQPDGPSVQPLVAFSYIYDYGWGNTVSLVAGNPPDFRVARVELRTWATGTNYWRAHLIPAVPEPNSGCTGYADIPGTWNVTRVGPRTWVGGSLTLSVDPVGYWTLYDSASGRLWLAGPWNGIGTVVFYATGPYPDQIVFSTGPCP